MEKDDWEQIRTKGMWAFVLPKFTIFWGGSMGFFGILTFEPPPPSFWLYEISKNPIAYAAVLLVLACFFGTLLGLFHWYINEYAYKKAFKNDD
jgi:hypothetical protein